MPINTTHQVTNGSIESLNRPKVYSLNQLRSKALKLARASFDLVLPSDDAAEAWRQDADGLLVVGAQVTERDLEQVSQTGRLRFISKQGAGVDKIHIPTAKKHGIAVMNTPGVNAQAVAELAFGMMITYLPVLRFRQRLIVDLPVKHHRLIEEYEMERPSTNRRDGLVRPCLARLSV